MPNWLEFPLTSANPWLELGMACVLAALFGLLIHSLLHRLARRTPEKNRRPYWGPTHKLSVPKSRHRTGAILSKA